MKFIVRIGWADGSNLRETDWTTLEDAIRPYYEVFDPVEHTTLRKIYDQVNAVNGEGNYHEFVFQVLDVRGA